MSLPLADAHTGWRPLTGEVDLLALWDAAGGFLMERDGDGVVGSGTAASLVLLPGADQLHRAADAAGMLLDASGWGASGALAVAALPFDGGIPALLSVPARVVRREPGGRACELRLNLDEEPAAARGSGPWDTGPAWAGTSWRARPEPASATYAAAVSEAVRRIAQGPLRKVVLARTLVLEGAGPDPRTVLRRLRERDPRCHTVAVRGARGRLLVGATPETLLRRRGRAVLSVPLAGSAPRSSDLATDRAAADGLLASSKDRREHALVVEAVADALAPHCVALTVDDRPQLAGTASLWHLATVVRGRLRPGAPSALGLAADLHPTPAVCGTPRDAALGVIHELEPQPRGLYSGTVGWVDGRGDGDWAVTLRCAVLGEGWARLYAGAGIVEGSEPDAEVAETEAKFGALLEALGVCSASQADIQPSSLRPSVPGL